MTVWIAAAPQLVGTVQHWEMVYAWDGSMHPTRQDAIDHGLHEFDHDDFHTAGLDATTVPPSVVWIGWMNERHPDAGRGPLARSLGFDMGEPLPQDGAS